MLKRNRVTDEYKVIINYIREVIKHQSPNFENYDPLLNEDADKLKKWIPRAGLAETVGIINSFIIALLYMSIRISGYVELPLIENSLYVSGIIAFFLSFIFQSCLSIWSREKSRNEKTKLLEEKLLLLTKR